jgi:hypothetical protein
MPSPELDRWFSDYEVQPGSEFFIGNNNYFTVQHLPTKHFYFLKVLDLAKTDKEQVEDAKEAFVREVELLKRLRTFGETLEYIDSFMDGDDYVLVVEKNPFERTYWAAVQEGGPYETPLALDAGVNICRSLLRLREINVVHGNVNPYVMAARSEKALMFDLTSALCENQKPILSSLWMKRYLAPELHQGRWDERTDMYGLGRTILFLMTGKHPDEQPSDFLESLVQHEPAIGADLRTLLQSMIEQDPDKRPRDFQLVKNWLLTLNLQKTVSEGAEVSLRYDQLKGLRIYAGWLEEGHPLTEKVLELFRQDFEYYIDDEQKASVLELGVIWEAQDHVLRQNFVEAEKLIRQYAETNYPWAQNNLGVFYETGSGVEKDLNKAIRWYIQAASQNCGTAMENLAVLYQSDEVKNEAGSIHWFTKAAEQRMAESDQAPSLVVGVTYDWTASTKGSQKEKGRAQGRVRLPFSS